MATQRNSFTKGEDQHLVEYIARYNPLEAGRRGNKLYENLVTDHTTRSWSKNHTAQSWRNRYLKGQAQFDRQIKLYLKNKDVRRKGQLPSAPPQLAQPQAAADLPNEKTLKPLEPCSGTQSPPERGTGHNHISEISPRTHSDASASRVKHHIPSSMYPNLAELANSPRAVGPSDDAGPQNSKPKPHKRWHSPDRDSGFFESSPSRPNSPPPPPRELPRLLAGTFRSQLANTRKRPAISSDDENENGRPPRKHSSRRVMGSPTTTRLQDAKLILSPADNGTEKRSMTLSDTLPPSTNSSSLSESPTSQSDDGTKSVRVVPINFLIKPGKTSKSEPARCVRGASLNTNDMDDPFVDPPLAPALLHRRHTLSSNALQADVRHIDLKAESQHRRASSLNRSNRMFEKGLAMWAKEMAQAYDITERKAREVLHGIGDDVEAEKIIRRISVKLDKSVHQEIASFRRRSSAASSTSTHHANLDITPLRSGIEVEGDYHPPSESRAAQAVRLEKKRFTRSSETAHRTLAGESSPYSKRETPSPPQRLNPLWGSPEAKVLRSLSVGNMDNAKALQDQWGFEAVLSGIESILRED